MALGEGLGKFGTLINLKGERVWPKTEVGAIRKENKEENTRLIKRVKEKYLNSTYISGFDSSFENEWNFFNIHTLGNLAFVSYHWDAYDDEGIVELLKLVMRMKICVIGQKIL